ncbi:hypothetical protein ABVK25_010758 [Lepraria finkii]|uniref:Uncharacterized protein n=1 Tax=Lepraria finkii TaxID=1340010 RepID=A0ABR4AWA2_9LECA
MTLPSDFSRYSSPICAASFCSAPTTFIAIINLLLGWMMPRHQVQHSFGLSKLHPDRNYNQALENGHWRVTASSLLSVLGRIPPVLTIGIFENANDGDFLVWIQPANLWKTFIFLMIFFVCLPLARPTAAYRLPRPIHSLSDLLCFCYARYSMIKFSTNQSFRYKIPPMRGFIWRPVFTLQNRGISSACIWQRRQKISWVRCRGEKNLIRSAGLRGQARPRKSSVPRTRDPLAKAKLRYLSMVLPQASCYTKT